MKTRLLGAAVLIVLFVVFVPMFFSSKPAATNGGDQSVSLAIPQSDDSNLQTKTMSLSPDAPASTATAATASSATVPAPAAIGNASNRSPTPAVPAAAQAPSDSLPTAVIPSRRPQDAQTDASPDQSRPVRSMRDRPPASAPPMIAATPNPSKPAPAQVPAQSLPSDTAARGSFTLNLGGYASASSVQNLLQRVHGLGYPASSRNVARAGKSLTLVSAGPFETRAAAEAARLKIGQSVAGVRPAMESGATTPSAAAPVAQPSTTTAAAARPAAAAHAGGFAVQIAAMANQGDANALRDQLRANGFAGYVDTVNANGKQLWRVRAGPQTQRSDAERLRDQIKTKLGKSGNVVTVP